TGGPDADHPAVTRHELGAGTAWYVATALDPAPDHGAAFTSAPDHDAALDPAPDHGAAFTSASDHDAALDPAAGRDAAPGLGHDAAAASGHAAPGAGVPGEGRDLRAVLRAVLDLAGVSRPRGLPDTLELVRRGRHLFLLNHGDEPVTVRGVSGTGVLDGAAHTGSATVPAGGVTVVELAGDT
ncbi:Beta-galactosidase C-terminal domain, partial [Streptosporangium sp. NPDC048865]|uniref:Beta-galactosidase C-terminal domain n=1 Tax=Streptosporangium sp. NPDC048865 TaxID=3155766 RepID=UPI003435E66D